MTTDKQQAYSAKLKTPFAVLGIRTAPGVVTGIEFLPMSERAQAPTDALDESAVRPLQRYLDDSQFKFNLPLAAANTAFRQRFRVALMQIPVGESRTYGELAR